MPRLTTGIYQQPAGTAAVQGAVISSSAYNTLQTDIGNEITNSLDRQGRGAMAANLNAGGYAVQAVANPVANTDAVNKGYLIGQIQTSAMMTAVSVGGTSDAVTASFSPTIATLVNGLTVRVRFTTYNATSVPTLNVDGTGARQIIKGAGGKLSQADIAGAGYWGELTYDATGNWWALNNPATGVIAIQPGEIGIFASPTVPYGWVECNGQYLSQIDPTTIGLFNVIGGYWGVSGPYYAVPDFRGYFLRGWDHGAGVDPGRTFASAQGDQLQDHVHQIGMSPFSVASGGANTVYEPISATNTSGAVTGNVGAETRPKNLAVLICIKL